MNSPTRWRPGNEWATEGAESCCRLRTSAESWIRLLCRRFGLLPGTGRPVRTAMVRKGSPVRVRQRALRNRATTRFSCFRRGSDDHFRALPGEKGSGVAADGRCAAACETAEHVLFPAQGTEAVHGRRHLWPSAPRSSAQRSTPASQPRPRAGRAASRPAGCRRRLVGSESVATAARRFSQQVMLSGNSSGRLDPRGQAARFPVALHGQSVDALSSRPEWFRTFGA